MSLAEAHHAAPLPLRPAVANDGASAAPEYRVIGRNGSVTPFDPSKIAVALNKAFLAVEGTSAAVSWRVHETVEALTAQVVGALTRRPDVGRTFHIEGVQDQVELALMRGEHHKVARAYVLYREERTRWRAVAVASAAKAKAAPSLRVPCHLGVVRSCGGAGTLSELRGFAVVEGHPADRLTRAARLGAWQESGCRPFRPTRLAGIAHQGEGARHAQLKLHGDRADRDDLQYFVASHSRSNPPTRTSTSNRTCPATSRS
jgi:hypothetical protein